MFGIIGKIMEGKTLQQVVTDITGQDISKYDSRIFAEKEFAQIYAWIKSDVISNILAGVNALKSNNYAW